ncbi:MAG TPA: hypothetical protein VE646_10850, partial [Actinomycetota bacterium]|nr:hypothetical protein [Actinomycetota bacterium]
GGADRDAETEARRPGGYEPGEPGGFGHSRSEPPGPHSPAGWPAGPASGRPEPVARQPERPEPPPPEQVPPEPARASWDVPEPARDVPAGENPTHAQQDRDWSPVRGRSDRDLPPAYQDDMAQEGTSDEDTGALGLGRPASAAERAQHGSEPSHALARVNGEDRLPIFEAVESEWFRRRTSKRFASAPTPTPLPGEAPYPSQQGEPSRGGQRVGDAADPASPQAGSEAEQEPREWRSPGDEAWRAADSIRKPTTAGLTPAGLPIRIPKAHFVPGSAGKSTLPTPARTPARSPEAVRGRLSSFHQGVRQGRDAGRNRGEENTHNAPRNQDEENT